MSFYDGFTNHHYKIYVCHPNIVARKLFVVVLRNASKKIIVVVGCLVAV
jgi:hypothetical protein